MSEKIQISEEEVNRGYEKLKKDSEKNGYFLNPDAEFTKELVRGLLTNEKRYGYQCCPCRLSAKDRQKDLDIICPCDYRDADVAEFGSCYCGLYVSREAFQGKKAIGAVPERRKMEKESQSTPQNKAVFGKELSFPVWRCKVCGYLCARENPPDICPICKVTKDRFERFM